MADREDSDEGYALGIDLGTTSVKVVFVDRNNGAIVASESAETKADVDVGDAKKSEQSVNQIVVTVNELMRKFPNDLKRRVVYIGVSGQMHGVVMWKSDAWKWQNDGNFVIEQGNVSNLITWQDQRCSSEFLELLPETEFHDKVFSGFGLATMMWLLRNEPESFQRYQHCGTIQDLLVAILTQNTGKATMTDQNASGWGYYNANEKTWKLDKLISAGFPTDMLPAIKLSGETSGKLKSPWNDIPSGCTVGAAFGDLQTSILSILNGKESEGVAIISVSTSIQLTLVMPKRFNVKTPEDRGAVEYRPYFGGKYLALGAGLNGGNCLAFFVNTLKSWTNQLGQEITEDKIWEILLQQGFDQKTSDLVITPTLRGERYCPQKTAAAQNITPGNFSLGNIMRALCSGIVDNIQEILPTEMLKKYSVTKIYATGSALIRNRVIQEEVRKKFRDFTVEVCDAGDSSYGAALVGITNPLK